MKKILPCLIVIVLILSGCTESSSEKTYNRGHKDGYDDGYEEGYTEGKKDGVCDLSDVDWGEAEDYLKTEENATIVDLTEYAKNAGQLAGVFAICPKEDDAWKEYGSDESFADTYMDNYSYAYNYYSGISDEKAFDYKLVEMIDTSKSSDAILEVGYDEWHEILLIRWVQGDLYAYKDVDGMEFFDLITAESIGSYANKNIKNRYEYYKINE